MTASPVLSPHRDVPACPAVIWVLLAGNLLVRAAGFAYPFMAYHLGGRGHTQGTVGVVISAFGVGWVAGQLLCGWLIDRFGRRSTLTATMLSAAVVLALLGGAHTAWASLFGAVLAGVVFDAPRPVLSEAIAELIPDSGDRAKVDAWRMGWTTNVGAAISGGVGGLLAEDIGIPALIWINAAACAVFAAIALSCLPTDACRPLGASKMTYRQAFSDRRLTLLLASSVATLTASIGFFVALPMLMSARGLGAGTYGCAQLANACAVMALTPLLTLWLARKVAARPRLDMLAATAAWTTACLATAAVADSTLGFSLATAACAPGEIVWFVVAAGIVHRIAPPAHRGRYHGIWGMALALAAIAAPLLAASGLRHGGPSLVAVFILAVGLIGVALCIPLARVLARGMAPSDAGSGGGFFLPRSGESDAGARDTGGAAAMLGTRCRTTNYRQL
ncbi:MFS transporter [Mycobacterium paraense]|uniref:MFS transporter n=1 Tax=Mycobacterium paraense TaxID=767916 RepID=UPI000A1665B0|nr:MFS transporter [Mycobacterium paraense]